MAKKDKKKPIMFYVLFGSKSRSALTLKQF